MPNGEAAPETINDEFGSTPDDEFEEDEQEWKRYEIEGLSPELQAKIEEISKQLSTWDQQTTDEVDYQLITDQVETYYNGLTETVPAEDQVYRQMEGTTEAQKDAVAQQDRAARSKMRQRAVLILFSVAIAEALLVYLIKVRQSNPSPSGDFKQADADATKAMLDNWRGQSDPAFWAGIADYVEKANSSLQSQMVMMGYIKNWVAADPITWGPTEKSDDILALTRAVTPGHAGDMYRQVAGMQHNGAPLQRAVAADLCEHALAELIAQGQSSSQP
jgi:hypothetical protein